MRSGAVRFIKDPIRDILERQTFTNLYKFFRSTIMCALVVVSGVGNISLVVQTLTPLLPPFGWKPMYDRRCSRSVWVVGVRSSKEPLSTVPYDLVFTHLILPYTTHCFRPWTAVRQPDAVSWKWLSGKLRVSSYMFGDQHPCEEAASTGSFRFWPRSVVESDVQKSQSDRGWGRVPAHDDVVIAGACELLSRSPKTDSTSTRLRLGCASCRTPRWNDTNVT